MNNEKTPLAQKLRPTTLKDFVGQKHIVGENKMLYRAINFGHIGSCIFYGPPGTGKTTLANIIAKSLNGNFQKINAVSSGVGDAKAIIDRARKDKAMFGIDTYLLLDECHRWSKAQSDCVLEAIEDGSIIFIGSTTENPYTSMTRAIVSRCHVFEFKKLDLEDIVNLINRALKEGFDLPIEMTEGAKKYLADACGGDARLALNSLELAVMTTNFSSDKKIHIDEKIISESINKKPLSISVDMYYDLLSAFCKSIRGSDSEGALYYAMRLIKSGIDPLIIARRLIAHCSEDIGMADSNASLLALNACLAIEKMGLPEGLLPLSHAIIYACEAEKSNSVYLAMHKAEEDVEKYGDLPVPSHLKNHPVTNADGHGKYLYPHDFGGYCKQQYLPDEIKNHTYYIPSSNGREKNLVRKKKRGNKDV